MRLECYSILILFSIIGATNAQQQLDRNDDLTNRVYRNQDAVVFHDEYGNKILDGRSTETDDFEIHFTPSYEYGNKLYINFCAKDIGCDEERGLILCWEAPKWLKRNMTYSSNARIEYLQAQCRYDQGVMVTTVNGSNQFRVDTVYGSTYEFKISTVPNCFTLWLFGFDPYPGTHKQKIFTKKKRAVVNAWYPKLRSRNALSITLDNDGSNNGLPLDHPGDFDEKHRILDLKGNPIVMKDEEIQIAAEARRFWQPTKGDFETHHFTANFMAKGGGGCCNLTAKIMGKELSKCYFHWKDVYRCKDTCSEILKYGFHPKPLYGSLSKGPTTIDSTSPETTSPETTQDIWNDLPDTETTDFSTLSTTTTAPTANPKWIQYVNDPEEQNELEKQFGAYLAWNPAKYPDVSRAALYLLGNYEPSFSRFGIGPYHIPDELTRLQSEGRFELQDGTNESIDIPPDMQNDKYWGEIRQVVFRCLGIQIDTDTSGWYDNSDEEKKEWENMQNRSGERWPTICNKK